MDIQIYRPHLPFARAFHFLSLPCQQPADVAGTYRSCRRRLSLNDNIKERLRAASWSAPRRKTQTSPSRSFVNTFSAPFLQQPAQERLTTQAKAISTISLYQHTQQPDNKQQQQLTSPPSLMQLQLSQAIHEQLQNNISIQQITRECAVCAMNKPQHEFEGDYNDTCLHVERTVCDSCIYENTKYLVENTTIYDEQLTCPEKNCSGTFDFHTIRHILLSTGKNHVVFEQYNERLIYRHLEQMTEFVWCAHECGSGQLHDLEGSSSPEVICIKCKQRTCFTHRTVWHIGLTCADYDLLRSEVPDDGSHVWLEHNTKRCPQCQWYIEKSAGCDQMKCRRCQYKFCWECLADYNIISSQGKSKHRPSCSHYKPNRVNVTDQHETRRWCAVQ